jgi:uncharacterized protein (TIGR02145 family)
MKTKKFIVRNRSIDEIIIDGKTLTEILEQHLLWKKSKQMQGKKAIFTDIDFSNLEITPIKDMDDLFEIKSALTGNRYLMELLRPKREPKESDLPENTERHDWSEIEFIRCNFENSNLRWINFNNCIFQSCKIYDAMLSDSYFENSEFHNCQIINSKMSGKYDYAIFNLCNLSGSWFRDSNLPYAKMTYCIMHNVLLRGANCWECDFSHSDLQGANFESGWLEHAIFYNANLQNSNFNYAKVDEVDFAKSDLRGSNLTSEQIQSAKKLSTMNIQDPIGLSIKSPKVFLSYSWKDYKIVSAVDYWLRSQGIEVYRDEQEFYAGDSIVESMQKFIEKADFIVFFVSRNSKNRPYPKFELELARILEIENSAKTKVIYFCLDDTILDSIQKMKIHIQAYKSTFNDACLQLWYALTKSKKPIKQIDISDIDVRGRNWLQDNPELDREGTFKDPRDGKTYKIIKIGKQWWFAENLAHKVKNGCWAYNNDHSYVSNYGYLYNWKTAKTICPQGWHLPSDEEWGQLTNYLEEMILVDFNDKSWLDSISGISGGKMKSSNLWISPNTGATNESGFTALPAGCRNENGTFSSIGEYTGFWSSTPDGNQNAWYRGLYFCYKKIGRKSLNQAFGFSCRCLKD